MATSIRQLGKTERDGNKGKASRGWVQRHKEQREERKHAKRKCQMSAQCSQLGPKCGQREQEGKGRGEVQEETQEGQGEEEGDPRGEEWGEAVCGNTVGSRGTPQLGFAAVLTSAGSAARPPPGQPALWPLPCHLASPLPQAGSHPRPAQSRPEPSRLGQGAERQAGKGVSAP